MRFAGFVGRLVGTIGVEFARDISGGCLCSAALYRVFEVVFR